MEFIIFIYDKYSIVNSLEKDADYCSYLIGKSEKVIPNTSLEALSLFQDEMYNHQIFSEIMMKFRPNIKFIKKKKLSISRKKFKSKYSFLLKTLSYRLKKENGNNEIFILSSYLGLLRNTTSNKA